MSLFGRALAGAGTAISGLAEKYIDQDLQQQRAQALADLQRTTAKNIRTDDDTFRNDPERVARDRANMVADMTAKGTASNEIALTGARTAATDSVLQSANRKNTVELATASADAQAAATRKAVIDSGSDPAFLKARKAIAAAERAPESAAGLAQAAQAQFMLSVAKKTAAVQDGLMEAIKSGDTKAEEGFRAQLDVLRDKGGSKSDKFYAVASDAGKAMAPALKIIGDPNADPAAKEEAQTLVRQQTAIMQSAAKRAGVDLADAAKVPEAQRHAAAQAAIKLGAPAADVNARLVADGYNPLPGATVAPKKSIMDTARGSATMTASDKIAYERLDSAAAAKGYTTKGMGADGNRYYQMNGTGTLYRADDIAKTLGLTWN